MSVDAVGFDDEFDLRRLQAFAPGSSEPAAFRPISLFAASSVSVSAPVEKRLERQRPELSPPEHCYLLDIIELQNSLEELSGQYLDSASETIQRQTDEMQAISQERVRLLQTHAAAVASQQTWGIWSTIAQYISTAASTVLGISLISTGVGATAGYFLIASGGLGLANRVATDLGFWSYIATCCTDSIELQKNIAQWIDLGAAITSTAIGVAGGALAYKAGAFALAAAASGEEISGKVSQILSLGGSLLGVGSRLGYSIAERDALHLEANLKGVDTKNLDIRSDLDKESLEIKKTLEALSAITEEVKRDILLSEVTFD